ncbi:MAG: ABC transporter permease [Ignavibacteriales bacterium]|nr:ABC transporter permease [Ignavibacteriales bacterium]
MLSNYFKIALRNLLKHKGYSFINGFGLAAGIACCILIVLYVQDELSYDTFHADSDRIYRVVKDFVNADGSRLPDATTPPGLMPALVREIPEIETATRLYPSWGFKPMLTYGEKTFYEEKFLRVDSTFFDVFTYQFVQGNKSTVFAKPLSIVITQSLAKKYFGDDDPMGKILSFDRTFSLEVTGVLQDVPAQSHVKFDFLISIRSLGNDFRGNYGMDALWAGWYNFYTYIKLRPGAEIASVEPKIQALFKANRPQSDNVFYAQALTGINGIHLASHLKWELEPNSDRSYIYVFLTVALFVTVIAGINYVNLTTARSSSRAREVGMRKVVGAYRNELVVQFLSESVFLSLVASVMALGLTEISLSVFNGITQKSLSLFSASGWYVWPMAISAGLVLGIFAGCYPAFVLSSYSPISMLKSLRAVRRGGVDLRRILVVFQFALAISLIVGILVVQQQIDFIQTAKLGFSKDQVIVLRNIGSLANRGEGMRKALAQVSNVNGVAQCDGMIGGQNWTNSLQVKGSTNGQLVNFLSVGYDFLDVLGIELKEGRNFSPAFPSDSMDGIILNETAVKQLGVPEPAVGQLIVWAENQGQPIYVKVTGVVKDFHFTSFREEIKPFAFVFTPSRSWFFAVKIAGGSMRQTLDAVEATWRRLSPDRPIDYYFLDESIDKLYRSEQNFRTVFSTMTGLSVLIACLGLFGLASYTTEQRTKEIGIRKVLGASVGGVIGLLSKEFIKLVFVANIIAWPVAYFAMQRWLQDFSYRINFGWWIFALAGGIALSIALLTVSFQAVKAALTNPVEALRYE